MSIQSEIERISQAKTDIHSAIESKGVTVPDDTLISEMAPYIQQIREAGTVVTSVSYIEPDESGNVRLENLIIYCGDQSIRYDGGAEQGLTINPEAIGAATAEQGALADTAVQPAQIAKFITAEDIPDKLPNPNSLTIQLYGSSTTVYDGSVTKTINITPSSIGAAPMNHATSTRVYGIGTSSSYGHVMLSDSTTNTNSASTGCAATPYAVKQVNDNIPIVVHVNMASYDWSSIPGIGSMKWLNVVHADGITEDCEIFSVVPVSNVEGNYKWSQAECGTNQLVIYSDSKENPGPVNSIFAITKNVIQGVNSD